VAYSGTGRHILDVSPKLSRLNEKVVLSHPHGRLMQMLIVLHLQAGCASSMCYTIAMLFTKLSSLMLYSHIFDKRGYVILNRMLMAMVVATASYSVSMCVTVCARVAALWDCGSAPSCHGRNMWLASLGMHITTDFLIILLPLPLLLTMRAKLRQKLSVIMIFLLGLL
jgi:hypothetical protein